ncbi:MAG: hypothetical protein SFZ23_10465 [Planctomycetota bacterium]|nr:hypothetical protein [Planctomycetota bacterium]
MSDKAKPIHTIRIGAIQAAIWSNPGQHGPFYNVTLDRRFRDAAEQWQSSSSFGRDDLLILAKIADAAHTYICDRQAGERSHSENGQHGNGQSSEPAASVHSESGKRRSR